MRVATPDADLPSAANVRLDVDVYETPFAVVVQSVYLSVHPLRSKLEQFIDEARGTAPSGETSTTSDDSAPQVPDV
jgi:hypothetical protein